MKVLVTPKEFAVLATIMSVSDETTIGINVYVRKEDDFEEECHNIQLTAKVIREENGHRFIQLSTNKDSEKLAFVLNSTNDSTFSFGQYMDDMRDVYDSIEVMVNSLFPKYKWFELV